jgi:hypothetical protein
VRVTVLHHVNGATRTAVFEAPHVSRQMADGGIYVKLSEAIGGPELGDAMFTSGGIVELSGVAEVQYGLIEKED